VKSGFLMIVPIYAKVSGSLMVFGNLIDGVIVIVLSLSAVDCGLKPRSGETTDDKIGIRCFSSKHAALRNKSKD
jgi:hypothetical protein